MKRLAKLFALFIAVLGLVGLVSCDNPPKPEPVQPYNVLGAFVDGGDAIYTFGQNTESELSFSYEKADETKAWSYIYTDVAASLKAYKKLVITTKGSGTMKIKLESGADARAPGVGRKCVL